MSALSELLLAAGLTGRGGAGFATGVKLELAERHNAELIVNACDGEPDSEKDAWVIAHHLAEVLEGAQQLTRRHVRVAAHRDSETLAVLRAARVDTVVVPPRYVSSEESALVRLAYGGPARPLMRSQPVAAGSRDPHGRKLPPTLVLNAETVWRVQQIAENGPEWFRAFGTFEEPGPQLITLANGVGSPGVHSVEAGVPLREILDRAGGLTVPMQAVWVGGLGGGFLSADDAGDVLWSRESLARYGIRSSAGTLRVIEAGIDPWADLLEVLEYAVGESAGQCGPCMFGLPAILEDLRGVLQVRPPVGTADRLSRRLVQVSGRGACGYPDGVTGFLTSALEVFGTRSPSTETSLPVTSSGRHHVSDEPPARHRSTLGYQPAHRRSHRLHRTRDLRPHPIRRNRSR
ncbi:NADH-ubiquinone oxidoreductase-F iron-sulfur binding region domain-containing protein [Nocardia macrotermitis]|uniref:NADH-quinone oxidoreductase subunit F n=1 Tax=Nocardia macrotermitis TaxID=2585198 RepID=A0A7K0DBN2_9NOCA|nr:NADH-ubiquinone oxidoreductase-F iron-sulfur binding region domain-containing protein [Nocardia macrotermitis]MQY22702.1 NADH-quinone oxidoreductase subunit F [Nocardia macrotermitis]